MKKNIKQTIMITRKQNTKKSSIVVIDVKIKQHINIF